jgi:hypothetical protein
MHRKKQAGEGPGRCVAAGSCCAQQQLLLCLLLRPLTPVWGGAPHSCFHIHARGVIAAADNRPRLELDGGWGLALGRGTWDGRSLFAEGCCVGVSSAASKAVLHSLYCSCRACAGCTETTAAVTAMRQARHPREGMNAQAELCYEPTGSIRPSGQGVDCRCRASCERAGASRLIQL